MEGFFSQMFLGARVWIWFLFGFVVINSLLILAVANREKIKEKWLKFRHPERVIKIVIHYPSRMFKIYWRTIPTSETISIGNSKYHFNKEKLSKEMKTAPDDLEFKLNGKTYKYDKDRRIKHKSERWPEVHYSYDCIMPLDFSNVNKGSIGVSAADFKEMQDNDLWLQLLTMKDTIQQLSILIIIAVGNLLINLFMLAKMMGWLDK